MAILRRDGYSDLYVFDYSTGLVCWNCPLEGPTVLTRVGSVAGGGELCHAFAASIDMMIMHLGEHRRAGHRVPITDDEMRSECATL